METPRDALPTETAPLDENAPVSADPVAEVRSLRAKNRILRAERTAIAGRKYVLETVIETLRQKLEELSKAFAAVQAGGDVSEAIKLVGSIVHDAQRIADDKEALEGELESERAERLRERQAREAREFETEERLAGVSAERVTLQERVHDLEGKLSANARAAQDAEDLRRQLAAATHELNAAALELERAAGDGETRAKDLRGEREAREKAEKERDDRARELEEVRRTCDGLRADLDAARRVDGDSAEKSRGEQTRILERAKDEHARFLEEERGGHARTLETERGEHARALEDLRVALEHAKGELVEERAEREALSRALTSAQADHAHALEGALTDRSRALEGERRLREDLAASVEQERGNAREALASADAQRKALEAEKVTLEARLQARRKELDAREAEVSESRAKLKEQQPVVEALADRVDALEREVQKLSIRLGETRERGKVDVSELLVRAALLRRREQKARAAGETPAPAVAEPAHEEVIAGRRPAQGDGDEAVRRSTEKLTVADAGGSRTGSRTESALRAIALTAPEARDATGVVPSSVEAPVHPRERIPSGAFPIPRVVEAETQKGASEPGSGGHPSVAMTPGKASRRETSTLPKTGRLARSVSDETAKVPNVTLETPAQAKTVRLVPDQAGTTARDEARGEREARAEGPRTGWADIVKAVSQATRTPLPAEGAPADPVPPRAPEGGYGAVSMGNDAGPGAAPPHQKDQGYFEAVLDPPAS